MSALITVKNIRKVYRVGSEKVVALDNINLEIEQGEICCILGTSGSGKSTLLNQLAGLEKPSAGSVLIGKHNISTMGEDQLASFRQRNIGFIFQSYNLLGALTAAENVSMPLLFRGVDRSVRDKAAREMLHKVGLGDRAAHKPSEMSGGQQQRVGIARAFVAKPKIVFADEPTGNLDTKTTIEVMEMLVGMAHDNNITFILVTHDNELAAYADRIITIRDGKVIDDVRNIARRPSGNKAVSEEDQPEEAFTVGEASEEVSPAEASTLGAGEELLTELPSPQAEEPTSEVKASLQAAHKPQIREESHAEVSSPQAEEEAQTELITTP